MKKLFAIFIIFLLFLSIPLVSWAWGIMDELFFEDFEPEIVLKKGSLTLYWSADSYVPFGYQGRKLPSKGSKITIEADLEILTGNPTSFKYSWFLDEIFQEAKSGYGRDSFEFWVKKLDNASHTILLKVFNESRSFLVEESITIPITKPEIAIYTKENNRMNLPYTTSIENLNMASNKESSFLALPFFFNIRNLRQLKFNWTFADKTYDESSLTANVFGIKIINKKTGGSLEQTLKVIATNRRQPDQRAQKTVKLNIY